MPRFRPARRRSTPRASIDSYDECFSDFDDKDLDRIPCLSPKKVPHQFSPSLPSTFNKRHRASSRHGHTVSGSSHDDDGEISASSSQRSAPYPITPPHRKSTPSPMGSNGPVSAVRRGFDDLRMGSAGTPMGPPLTRRLFQPIQEPSAAPPAGKPPRIKTSVKKANLSRKGKGKPKCEPIEISSDGSDGADERDEVPTDLESPTRGGYVDVSSSFRGSLTSLHSTSSFTSTSSADSAWSRPSTTTFFMPSSHNSSGHSDLSSLSRSSSLSVPPSPATAETPGQHAGVSPKTPCSSSSPVGPPPSHSRSTLDSSTKVSPSKARLRAQIEDALQKRGQEEYTTRRQTQLHPDDDVFMTPAPSSHPSGQATGPISFPWTNSQQVIPAPIPAPMDSASATPLETFLRTQLGVELQPYIIAHDAQVQKTLDKARIAWGVQYELARGISKGWWTWSDIELKIGQLKGTNKEIGYKVGRIIRDVKSKMRFMDLSIWDELDREQAALMENKERGLGLMGDWMGVQNWFGGQIQQIGRLTKFNGMYVIRLEPLEKRRSYRLARYLGSRRVLQVKVPDEMVLRENETVRKFFLQKFILCGRVFVPLFSKDNGVYMVESGEDWERDPVDEEGDGFRKRFEDIVRWHNDLALNKDQPISKWMTRFALAFSNSVPILLFDEENIHSIDDIYAPSWPKPDKKTPAEMILTDGCGLINEAALRRIADAMDLKTYPTAVQGRIAGGKGLWILHPENDDEEPMIWIRKSQLKIHYALPLDRAHCIFDLLTISHSSYQSGLTKQSIINVWHNGVPAQVLTNLLETGLRAEVEPLLQWDRPEALPALWSAISNVGNVTKGRLVRLAAGLSRAWGLQKREWGHEDIGLEDDADGKHLALQAAWTEELSQPAFTGRNAISGAPVSIYETTVELLQAGFKPDQFDELREKLRKIVEMTTSAAVEKFVIPLPLSTSAFAIPDPLGFLKEGEVYFQSVQPLVNPETKTSFHVVKGPVLIGRYPVRLPSDIQEALAVERSEYHKWKDVLILPIQGDHSKQSEHSGGDYDGDENFIIWDQRIVAPFKSKPVVKEPPNLMENNFKKEVEMVADFAHRVVQLPPRDAQTDFQSVLLLGLHSAQVGLYSGFHDFAAWKFGYDDPRTIRLAFIFNVVLDSSKTGHRLKDGVYEQDQHIFGGKIPESADDVPLAKPFVFHLLHAAGKQVAAELLSKYDNISGTGNRRVDSQLKRPYDRVADIALEVFEKNKDPSLNKELKIIRDSVDRALNEWSKAVAKKRAREEQPSHKKKRLKRQAGEPDFFLNAANAYAEEIPEGSLLFYLPIVDELKASYAYQRNSHFALNVAFKDLCNIKAAATKENVACTRQFDEAKTISPAYTRTLGRFSGMDDMV